MAKFYGRVGYGDTVETPPGSGVFIDTIEEFPYYGDVLRESRQTRDGDKVNDDISVGHRVSIVADAYAWDHIFAIRYIWWNGARWRVSDVEVQRPRLILRLGGLYHGPTP